MGKNEREWKDEKEMVSTLRALNYYNKVVFNGIIIPPLFPSYPAGMESLFTEQYISALL